MKGILLVGGSGSRLAPITTAVPKSLLPVYNKPMVYYSMSLLLQAGLREILVISTVEHSSSFRKLLGNGSQFGCRLDYTVQDKPEGIAQAWIIANDWLDGKSSCLVLGDNILHGDGLGTLLRSVALARRPTIFGYHVSNPSAYGVVEMSDNGISSFEEKPDHPRSNLAIPGIYFVDETAPKLAKGLTPSKRGELEVVDLLRAYLPNRIGVIPIGKGFAWLDAGTPESLLDASNFIATLERRCGLQIGDPTGIARERGWIK